MIISKFLMFFENVIQLTNVLHALGSILQLCGWFQDGSSIPDTLLDQLIATRHCNAGYANLRQIVSALFDQVEPPALEHY
jgi:Zn-dependent oligopeptidase